MSDDLFSSNKERFALLDIRDDVDRMTCCELDEPLVAYLADLQASSDPYFALSAAAAARNVDGGLQMNKLRVLTANEERLVTAAFLSVSPAELCGIAGLQAILAKLNMSGLPDGLVLRVARLCHILVPNDVADPPPSAPSSSAQQHAKLSSPRAERGSRDLSLASARGPHKLSISMPTAAGVGNDSVDVSGLMSHRGSTSARGGGDISPGGFESARKRPSAVRHLQTAVRTTMLSARRSLLSSRGPHQQHIRASEPATIPFERVLSLGTVINACKLLKRLYFGPDYQKEAELLEYRTVADVFAEADARFTSPRGGVSEEESRSVNGSAQPTARNEKSVSSPLPASCTIKADARAVDALLMEQFGLVLPQHVVSNAGGGGVTPPSEPDVFATSKLSRHHRDQDAKQTGITLRSDQFWSLLNQAEASEQQEHVPSTRHHISPPASSWTPMAARGLGASSTSPARQQSSGRAPHQVLASPGRGSGGRAKEHSPEKNVVSTPTTAAPAETPFRSARNDDDDDAETAAEPSVVAELSAVLMQSAADSSGIIVPSNDQLPPMCDSVKPCKTLAEALHKRQETLRIRTELVLQEKLKKLKRCGSAAPTKKLTAEAPPTLEHTMNDSFVSKPELYSTHGNSNIYCQGSLSIARRARNRKQQDANSGEQLHPPPVGTFASGVRGPLLARRFEGICAETFLREL